MRHPQAVLRGRRGMWVVAVIIVAVLIVATHLGAGRFVVMHPEWSLGVVAAAITAKVLAVAGYQLRKRRRQR